MVSWWISNAHAYSDLIAGVRKRGINITINSTAPWFPPSDNSIPVVQILVIMLVKTYSGSCVNQVWGLCLRLAFLQPFSRCLALCRILTLKFDTCCHNLRFLSFEMLHIMVLIISIWNVDSCCNKLKMMSGTLWKWLRDEEIKCQTLAAFHTSLAVLQWKKYVVLILMGVIISLHA